MGTWAAGGEVLSGIVFVICAAGKCASRGRRLVRCVTSCGTWSDRDVSASGGVAAGVGSGDERITMGSLGSAPAPLPWIESFPVVDTAAAL